MILMYHKIHPDSPTMWWVHVNDFYRQMFELSNKEVVYLDDYDSKNKNQVVITFDGVYKNVLDYALPILKFFNYPFELFITTDYIGLDNKFDSVEPNAMFANVNELKELVSYKGRLQWHTKSHINLKEVEDEEIINNELEMPFDIKELDRKGFNWFAYPHGEFNDVVVDLVKRRFKGAVSCVQGNDEDIYRLNRITVESKTTFKTNKVSCIIASYNYGEFLVEAIESVLRQTIIPDEILISDDCSTDDTRLIAESYVKKYPNLIKYNRNETNLGIVNHFNKAIQLTNGEYVFFLGADNRLLSNYVEKCINVLDSSDNVAIAYTDYAFFGNRAKLIYDCFSVEQQGNIIENIFYSIKFPEFKTLSELKDNLRDRNFIHGSSMYKRKVFNEVGGYLKSNKAEDYNLFKRIVEKDYLAKKVHGTSLEYRQHSASQANNLVSLYNRYLLYKKTLDNKSDFERTKIYRVSLIMYKTKMLVINNYKDPKKILYKVNRKLMKKFLKK